MHPIATELKQTIARHLDIASQADVLAIASALCAESAAAVELPVVSVAAERFTLIGEDQVFDIATDLIWTRDDVPGGRKSWKDAAAACAALKVGNALTWRLPTIKELLTLVDYEHHSPAIDPIFKCESAYYWTSTPLASSPGDYAWYVDFGYGYANYDFQGYDSLVRAVRPRQ